MLKNRLFGLGYILTAFFVIPFLLLLGSKDWVKVKTYHIIQQPCNVLVYPMQNTRTITESKKIYYKQVNKLRSDTQIQPYLLTYPLHIQKKEEVLFINQQPWMLASQGYCWEGTDKIGRFIICIDSISTKKLRENQRYRTDTTYFFSKKYLFATQKEATNWLIKLEVDISRKLVKKYTICSQTDLLYQESMISLF